MKNLKKSAISLMIIFVCIFSFNIQSSHAASKFWTYAAIGVGVVVVGTVGFIFAAPIAVGIGSSGLLGAASTGTAISGLTGASATSASLAAMGGGAIGSSAVATGMAGGTAVITGGSAIAGGAVSGTAAYNLLPDE